jgi:hypothetical protein
MSQTVPSSRADAAGASVAWGWLVGAMVLAAALRVPVVLLKPSLQYDDYFGAGFVVLDFLDMLYASVRLDVHPPLYYAQLWLWARAGYGDDWLLLNSVAWSVAGVAAVGWAGTRLLGRDAGIAAALLLALSPLSAEYAQQLRMYAMVMCLATLAWYRMETGLDQLRRGHVWQAAALQAAVCLAHAGGPLIAALLGAAGAVKLVLERRFDIIWTWLLASICAGVVAAAVLGHSLLRGVQHLAAATWLSLPQGYGELLLGRSPGPDSLPVLVGGLATWIAVAIGAWRAGLRRRGLLLIVLGGPVLVLLISLVSPIWDVRSLSHLAPFVALSLAPLVASVWRRAPAAWRLPVAAALLAAGTLASATVLRPRQIDGDYTRIARMLNEQARPGDHVLTQRLPCFWAMARYLVGPTWGSPLAVQPLPENPRWQAVAQALPAWVYHLVTVQPTTDRIDAGQMTLRFSRAAPERIDGYGCVWLLQDGETVAPAADQRPPGAGGADRHDGKLLLLDLRTR